MAKEDAAPPKKEEKKEEKKEAALLQLEDDCDPALDVSQKQLDIELDFFSRTFDEKRYRNAKLIYNELIKKGEHPRVSVHTW